MTTHANQAMLHPLMQALRDSVSTGTAILGSALFGLVATSQCFGQQPNDWSPQPFPKPNAEVSNTQPNLVPPNSLRRSQGPQNGEVLRWGTPNNSMRSARAEPSYAQALSPQALSPQGSQHQSDILATATPSKTIHQPAVSVATTRPPSLEPRSGFELVAPAIRNEGRIQSNDGVQQFSHVQLASHNEASAETPAQERRTSGVWVDRSVPKSTVQTARFQEPQAGPPLNLLPQDLPPANDLLPNDPKLNQPSKTGKSLLEPDKIPSSPFPGRLAPKQESNDPSPSENDPAPTPSRRLNRRSVDCDSVRLNAQDSDITKIRIDSSPSFAEGPWGKSQFKMEFIASAPIRPWLSYDGQLVAEGKLVDLRLGSVFIELADGTQTSYLLNKLSDADQVYVSEKWRLPVTCSIDDRSFPRRDFVDTTVTWKASGACHKPLYFEDVQLERYGHEWGPLVQPVLSASRFFGDVIVLPYKMGIHPMNECQYSLGHYRPGSCAPWTVGPVPISLRGALLQAKVVTGAALLLP